MSFIKEFWEFLKVRKKYWLLPILIILAFITACLVLFVAIRIGAKLSGIL